MTLTRVLSLAAETMSALNGYRLAQGHKADLSPAPTPNTAPDSAPAHTPSRVMAATVRAPSAQVALAPWHASLFPWHAGPDVLISSPGPPAPGVLAAL